MTSLSASFGRLRSRGSFFVFIALFFCAATPSCSQSDPETGGETHFLRLCDPTTAACGDGLACLCGACTLSCDEARSCPAYPGTTCAAASPTSGDAISASCQQDSVQGTCELRCVTNTDCAVISAAHLCTGGVCRLDAGSGLTGGGTSACGAASLASTEVVVLGDSFLGSSHEVTAYLEELAQAEGAIDAGSHYRDYSRLTDNALAWMGEGIRSQYELAQGEGEVQLVVLNGGGADVLWGDCETPADPCPLLSDAAAAFASLLQAFAEDGVERAVFVGYPDPTDPAVRARLDALRPLLEEVCSSAPLPCSWVDLRAVFEGHYGEFLDADGLNPTSAGAAASAGMVWEAMTACSAL